MTQQQYSRPKVELTPKVLDRLNIGKRYWQSSLDTLPKESKHYTITKEYVKEFALKYEPKGIGLFLWGNNSTGKTWTATAILKELAHIGYTAYTILGDELRAIYINNQMFDPDNSIIRWVENVEILLIEDIGKEYNASGSGWAELCFENLLRKRSRNLKVTIITTNLSPDEFKDRYKNSAMAILLESMIAIQVKSTDNRAKIQAEIQKTIVNPS
ncbi:DnaC DNA replication protein [uncultured Caudovirales phage]|uniref:DnaC DNA replication protein n=1 Tax=uncultured Caudovirales phage TaxID=2100421 RepID=A0A6J7X5N5_9CAUD|nr:DnaC DNA replication protein [uncultured Caudovirales phage]